MNPRELKCAYRVYDLLLLRGKLAILANVQDIQFSIFADTDDYAKVRVLWPVHNVSVYAPAAVDAEDLLENRLALATVEYLIGVHK
jgi:hypothetical protein